MGRVVLPKWRVMSGVAVALVAGGGCGADFDPATFLAAKELRLLATRADPPEVLPGERVTLSALVVDPGGARPEDISVEWSWCNLGTNASAFETVNPDCLKPEGGPFLVPLGSGHSLVTSAPLPDPSKLALPDGTGGIYVSIRVSVRAPGVEAGDPPRTVDGIYRLRIAALQLLSPPPPRNQNPELVGMWLLPDDKLDGGPTHPQVPDGLTPIPDAGTGITPGAVEVLDGQPLAMRFGDGWTLRSLFADGANEDYFTSIKRADVEDGQFHLPGDLGSVDPIDPKHETLTVRWYATTGRVREPVTGVDIPDTAIVIVDPPETPDESKLKPSMIPAPGAIIDVYAVGRDERGGTSWLHRQLRNP